MWVRFLLPLYIFSNIQFRSKNNQLLTPTRPKVVTLKKSKYYVPNHHYFLRKSKVRPRSTFLRRFPLHRLHCFFTKTSLAFKNKTSGRLGYSKFISTLGYLSANLSRSTNYGFFFKSLNNMFNFQLPLSFTFSRSYKLTFLLLEQLRGCGHNNNTYTIYGYNYSRLGWTTYDLVNTNNVMCDFIIQNKEPLTMHKLPLVTPNTPNSSNSLYLSGLSNYNTNWVNYSILPGVANNSTLGYLNSWDIVLLNVRILNGLRSFINSIPSIYNITTDYLLSTNIFFPPSSGINSFKNVIRRNYSSCSLDQTFTKRKSLVLHKSFIILRLSRYFWLKSTGSIAKFNNLTPLLYNFLKNSKSNAFKHTSHLRYTLALVKLLRRHDPGNNFSNSISYLYRHDFLPIELSLTGPRSSNKETTLNSPQKFLLKNIGLMYHSKLSSYFLAKSNTLIYKKLKVLSKKVVTSELASNLNNVYRTKNISEIFFKKFLIIDVLGGESSIIKFLYLKSLLFEDQQLFSLLNKFGGPLSNKSLNLIPSTSFSFRLTKSLVSYNSKFFIKDNFTPWIYNNVIRFIEFCSGKKAMIQVYSFMNQSVELDYIVLYRRWMPRLFFYERRLGHRFFLEEALHILHMGFALRDTKLLNSWLAAIIKRISFWKTRLIFRFMRYLFNNYFSYIFHNIGLKGFKVRLKGKISVAGNSRKRSILYRSGITSHSNCSVRVVHTFSTINTFTGVLGFQVWLFY